MLIVDMRAVRLPGEAKLNNLPPKRGQPIDADGTRAEPLHQRRLLREAIEVAKLKYTILIQLLFPSSNALHIHL
jgi:hypothetical protein